MAPRATSVSSSVSASAPVSTSSSGRPVVTRSRSTPGTTVVVAMVPGYAMLSTCSRSPGTTTCATGRSRPPMADANGTSKPDFTAGFQFQDLRDRVPVAGRAGDDDVILVRRGDEVLAVGAHCTHYHGPLVDGLVVGDTVRCPWHHACFSLRTGEALRAPALDSIACYRVERSGDTVFVRGKTAGAPSRRPPAPPASIVIVGGGAAGLAAADMLRREGYDGPLTRSSASTYASGRVSRDSTPPQSVCASKTAARRRSARC